MLSGHHPHKGSFCQIAFFQMGTLMAFRISTSFARDLSLNAPLEVFAIRCSRISISEKIGSKLMDVSISQKGSTLPVYMNDIRVIKAAYYVNDGIYFTNIGYETGCQDCPRPWMRPLPDRRYQRIRWPQQVSLSWNDTESPQ